MTEVEEKITTEPEEAEEEGGETQENELIADDPPPEPLPPAPEAPTPKKKAASKKTPKLLEIPVDPPAPAPPAPAPVLERTASSTTPAPKQRGRPKGAVGAAKRAQATERAQPPPTPREPEQLSPEDHVSLMLRHTRAMHEARRTAVRDKYRSWVG